MAGPQAVRVSLEAVTPLFLAGAEPRGTPELRAPAFRGALRYWFRAAAGGALGGNTQAVARAEREVFGAAAGSGSASAVIVRLHLRSSNPAPRAYKTEDFGSGLNGRNYLYWSMAPMGAPAKQYYLPRTAFACSLAPRPGVLAAGNRLEQAAAALWLLVQLGGVGSRSRRLGGSLSASEPVDAAGLAFALQGASAAEVADELRAGLRQVRAIFQRA
ncbi:MAG TPA: type III-B CRISPR module RAMP protein Cmr1, partial [Chloroflexota bacterium]|nr:type III-B CRISPR module RAMP protein Cmr1 [Chloroflexota bacterium]